MAAIREKSKKFNKFVQGLKSKHSQVLLNGSPLLDRFIFYLFFYSNPVTYARKAYKSLTDDKQFASWSEVRVATVREIADVLTVAKVKPAPFLAPRIKSFLQRVFEEIDYVAFEPLVVEIGEAENAKEKKERVDRVKTWVQELVTYPGQELPPWGATYLLNGMGLDNAVPWDPHTEAVLESQKLFPAKSTLTQKKRVAKALLEGFEDLTALDVHHLLVEYAKRDLKRK